MSKYTPGPWMARFEKVRYVIFVDGEIGEKALATTGGAYPDSEANALLIASAPDLLEAVIQYRDDLKRPPSADSIERRLAMVNAAIAKALGEQA